MPSLTSPFGELVALAASVALWIAGGETAHAVARASARKLPRSWREHPELRDAYEAFLHSRQTRDWSWMQHVSLWWVGLVVVFALLALLDVLLVLSLSFCVLLAGYWTKTGRQEREAASADFVHRTGLPARPRDPRLHVAYWASEFVSSLGFTSACVWAGYLLVRVVWAGTGSAG